MNNSDILDSEETEKNQLILFSKLSIGLTFLMFSPILGGYLYCVNLRLSNQKEKIISTYITILFIYLLSFLPFLGFKLDFYGFEPILKIPILITIGIIMGPMWSKHFSHLKYGTKFPIKYFLIMLGIFALATLHNYWHLSNSSSSEQLPSYYYLVNFSVTSMLMIFMYLFIGRIIYIFFSLLIKGKKQKSKT